MRKEQPVVAISRLDLGKARITVSFLVKSCCFDGRADGIEERIQGFLHNNSGWGNYSYISCTPSASKIGFIPVGTPGEGLHEQNECHALPEMGSICMLCAIVSWCFLCVLSLKTKQKIIKIRGWRSGGVRLGSGGWGWMGDAVLLLKPLRFLLVDCYPRS